MPEEDNKFFNDIEPVLPATDEVDPLNRLPEHSFEFLKINDEYTLIFPEKAPKKDEDEGKYLKIKSVDGRRVELEW